MTPREYNSILAVVAGRASEVYNEEDGLRQSGKTFRAIMRTFLWASANPGKRALYATMSQDSRRHAFNMAVQMISSAGVKAKVNRDSHSITFPNGAIAEFRCMADTGYMAGKQFVGVVRDVDGV